MKKQFIIAALTVCAVSSAIFFMSAKPAAESKYLQITAIESVVPGGLGRSRMITATADGKLDEMKLENFFSLVGINFENIRFNDRAITDKIEDLSRQGWELIQVTPGVYSADKSTGIFITRYLFKK
jgi:hypothetical protein